MVLYGISIMIYGIFMVLYGIIGIRLKEEGKNIKNFYTVLIREYMGYNGITRCLYGIIC